MGPSGANSQQADKRLAFAIQILGPLMGPCANIFSSERIISDRFFGESSVSNAGTEGGEARPNAFHSSAIFD